MVSDERAEAELRIAADPLAYHSFNPAQCRFVQAIAGADDGLVVVVALMGNGTGKSFGLISIMAAVVWGSSHPLFAQAPFGKVWPYVKDLRLVSNAPSLEDVGPIQSSMSKVFPPGRWGQSRGVGKGYYSQGWSDTGFKWDAMTYNQASKDFASHTKGAVFFSEPPPEDIFIEATTRLRGRGLVVIEMTPLTYAAWVKHRLVDPGWLTINGKRITKVHVVRGEIHDNCRDHNPGGQLTHEQVEAQIALWPVNEREARRKGDFMALAGLIYPNWGDANELEELPPYHQDCWNVGKVKLVPVLDPHDRKPFALTWFAIFPNSDVIAVAEWPTEDYEQFGMSPVTDIEEYRSLVIATEAEIGRSPDRRLIDPRFGNAPKAGSGETVKQMFEDACRDCKRQFPKGQEHKALETCTHKLYWEDPPSTGVESGHIRVRAAIGDTSKNIRPKLYALKDLRNFCYGKRTYAYDDKPTRDSSRGPSLVPQLINKDFNDLDRYLYDSGMGEWWETPTAMNLWTPKIRGNSVRPT